MCILILSRYYPNVLSGLPSVLAIKVLRQLDLLGLWYGKAVFKNIHFFDVMLKR